MIARLFHYSTGDYSATHTLHRLARIHSFPLQLPTNPPVRIIRFVENRGGLAEAGEVLELAGFDRRADFAIGDDLDRTVGQWALG